MIELGLERSQGKLRYQNRKSLLITSQSCLLLLFPSYMRYMIFP